MVTISHCPPRDLSRDTAAYIRSDIALMKSVASRGFPQAVAYRVRILNTDPVGFEAMESDMP